MSTALTIIRVFKWLSTLGLLLTVAIGAAVVDRRITMLLLPPFFMYWGQSESFAEIPIIKLLKAASPRSIITQRLFLAGAGVGCALLLDRILAPAAAAPPTK